MTSQEDTNECGICLDALEEPVALPCGHIFCSQCLDGWRSKYNPFDQKEKKCPMCRKNMPPSREMVNQMRRMRLLMREPGASGVLFREAYTLCKNIVGDDFDVEVEEEEQSQELEIPDELLRPYQGYDIGTILNWLGPPPVDIQKLRAKDSRCGVSLLHFATIKHDLNLMSILLQLGADIERCDDQGNTSFLHLFAVPSPHLINTASLLLQWGAIKFSNSTSLAHRKEYLMLRIHEIGDRNLVNILESEFGGRRCEIVGMQNRVDLNGQTCLVEKYYSSHDRYKVVVEATNQSFSVLSRNLKRYDRTPDDCGYYIEYKRGTCIRHNFSSKEMCQAFKASLEAQTDSSPKAPDASAEARAEKVDASSLAELDLEGEKVNNSSSKKKSGKKKNRRRGKKK